MGVAIVAVGLLTSGCTAVSGGENRTGANGSNGPGPSNGPGGSLGSATVGATSGATVPPGSTVPPFAATTTSTDAPHPVAPVACPKAGPVSGAPVPGSANAVEGAKLATALDDLRAAGSDRSVSVSIDGMGTIVAEQADKPLVPASNQKLLVAVAALEVLGPDTRLHTSVVATGPTVDGTIEGDLVLVGGGDPTLVTHPLVNAGLPPATPAGARATTDNPASLDALAAQLATSGIHRIRGRLLVDETRFDDQRTAPGWPANWSNNVGALSAVIVDRNRGAADPDQVTDPALTGARLFEASVRAAGITVDGDVAHGTTATANRPGGVEVAGIDSPPTGQIVAEMLSRSDNLIAETLVKELGRRVAGTATTAAGLAAARQVAEALCAHPDGVDADGSGLSPGDSRSSAGLRRLLEVARTRPWGTVFRDGLAVAGQTGTLAARLLGGATAGRVRAKTGSTAVSRALSGYLTAADGRQITFSIIVNNPSITAEKDIDAFVTAMATRL